MLKRGFLIIALLMALPNCGPTKNKQQHAELPVDNTQMADQILQEERGLVGSFLKKIQEYRTAHDTMSNQNYQELRAKLKEYQKRGDLVTALKYAEKMYAQCEEEQELIDLLLLCADLCVSQKNYKKASTLYNEFVRLYPRIPEKSAYAWYRAIICSENQQTSSNDRDQTITQETIVLAESFLKQGELFAQYKQEVTDILERCRIRLVEHELYVVRFYLHRGNLSSAAKRLVSIRTDWIAKCTSAEPLILIHEYLVASAYDNNELMQEKVTELATKFPIYLTGDIMKTLPYAKPLAHSATLILADTDKKQTSFINRF